MSTMFAASDPQPAPGPIITRTFVPGRPKTKGSLERVGGRMVESVPGSKLWRGLMAEAVRNDRRQRGLHTPCAAAVAVVAMFFLPVPTELANWLAGEARTTDDLGLGPGEEHAGDVDKLSRNLLDAMTDATAYADDVQVQHLTADKVYAVDRERTGVAVLAYEMTADEVRWRRHRAVAAARAIAPWRG